MLTVYTKAKKECIYCVNSIKYIRSRGLPVRIYALDPEEETDRIYIENLKSQTRHNCFPFIFDDGNFIGGYTHLIDYLNK